MKWTCSERQSLVVFEFNVGVAIRLVIFFIRRMTGLTMAQLTPSNGHESVVPVQKNYVLYSEF